MYNKYNGKRPKSFSVKVNKQGVQITIYLPDKTIVSTIDKDGNIETSEEPII